MTTEGFADDGTMIKDLAQFDVAQEIADSEQKKPWESGHYAKTLFKEIRSQDRIDLYGEVRQDKRSSCRWHNLRASIKGVNTLHGTRKCA